MPLAGAIRLAARDCFDPRYRKKRLRSELYRVDCIVFLMLRNVMMSEVPVPCESDSVQHSFGRTC